MHSVFLYHAISAGLDMGIVNPGMLKVYDEIEPGLLKCVEDVILDSDAEATDRLIEKASRILDEKNSVGVSARPEEPEATCAARPVRENGRLAASGGALTGAESSNISSVAEPVEAAVEERLVRALVKGDSSGLERDINECLTLYDKPVEIIDGAADERDGSGRGTVRGGKDVPASGGKVGQDYEECGGSAATLH